MSAAFRVGLHHAWRQPRLALALWLVNLVLAATVAGPAFVMLLGALARAPEGDRLLDGFSFGLAAELVKADPGGFSLLFSLLAVAAALALLANALTSGGVLDVLTTDDTRSFLHRFGRGAGRFFGRFLRAGIAAGALLLVTAGGVSVAMQAIAPRLEDSAWEPMPVAVGLVCFGLVAAIAVVALLGLDFARIRMVRGDGRGVLRLYWAGLRLVLGRPVATLGLWAGYAALFGLVLAAYAGVRNLVATTVVMVAAQQLVMFARAGLRVALFAGEIALDPLDREGHAVAAPQTERRDAA